MSCRLAAFCSCWLLLGGSFSAFALEYESSGHIRGQTTLSRYREDHILSEMADQQLFLDGSIDLRLNGAFFFTDHASLELAYEAVGAGGQTREAMMKLPPDSSYGQLFMDSAPSDDSQLFDLTGVSSTDEEYIAYHRIDRLFVTLDSDYGTAKIGRQALTWGNGQVFNPADLVNPFAPADIIRDYKVGTDMLLYQTGGEKVSDFQLVYVPRRNQEDDKLDEAQSTYGGKIRISHSEMDIDLLLLRSYGDAIIGGGLTGFLGSALYRTDWTLTFLKDDPERDQYLSVVANLDYSWVFQDKNWYGFIELYYNGLGADSPGEALQDEVLVDRLLRGELFVTGKYYFDAMIQYEAHPLINCFISGIVNLKDFSFLLQPRLVWEITESAQILTGINLPVGGTGDEFGEDEDLDTGLTNGRAVQGYAVLTWFF